MSTPYIQSSHTPAENLEVTVNQNPYESPRCIDEEKGKSFLVQLKDYIIGSVKSIYLHPSANNNDNNNIISDVIRGASTGGIIHLAGFLFVNMLNEYVFNNKFNESFLFYSACIPVVTNLASGIYELSRRNRNPKPKYQIYRFQKIKDN